MHPNLKEGEMARRKNKSTAAARVVDDIMQGWPLEVFVIAADESLLVLVLIFTKLRKGHH